MKSNLENRLDAEFKARGIKPYIYHITKDTIYFTGFTIVHDKRMTLSALDHLLSKVYAREELWELYPITPATRLLTGLREQGIYGVAICNERDQYSKKRGRIIAKGRLLKHLRGSG